ncbi:MAG: phosphonate ABC transporter, permease protein PhnE [bacterium]
MVNDNTGTKKLKKEYLKAFLLDFFLVTYGIIISYRIIYIKLIKGVRFPSFPEENIVYCCAIGILLAVMWSLTKNSLGNKICGLIKNGQQGIFRNSWKFFAGFLIILTFIAGWEITQISVSDLFNFDGLQGAKRIFHALFQPNTSIFDQVLFAIIETIYIALMSTCFAIPIAFILSFLGARNLMKQNKVTFTIYCLVRIVLNFCRSIEPLIWAIIFSVWVGIGPFAGMLALMLHSITALGKLYSEQIESVSERLIEAITATGASFIQVIWFAVVPQIILPFLSFTIYRWDINVRMATIIGFVGGGGIGTLLIQYQGLAKWNEVGLIIIMIAIVVWILDYISAKIREAIY